MTIECNCENNIKYIKNIKWKNLRIPVIKWKFEKFIFFMKVWIVNKITYNIDFKW